MKKRKKLLPRILISLIGTLLIIAGAAQMLLGFAGERATAVITSIRREGGERDDAVPGRYNYSVGYTFYLPDGREISGSTKKIGGAVYLETDGKSTMEVRYFTGLPWLSVPEEDTGLRAVQFILIGAGMVLIWLINGQKTIDKPSGRTKTK